MFLVQCPKKQLGDNFPPDKELPRRDHNLYRMISDANTKAANAELSLRHVTEDSTCFDIFSVL
jgi:hypothetical protein